MLTQILQIFSIYITCYLITVIIDRYIDNDKTNLLLRLILTIFGSILISLTFIEPKHDYDYSVIGQIGLIFFATLELNTLVMLNDKQQRQNKSIIDIMTKYLNFMIPTTKRKQSDHLTFSWSNILSLIYSDIIPTLLSCFIASIINKYCIDYLNVCLNTEYKVNLIINNYFYIIYYSIFIIIQILCIFHIFGAVMQLLTTIFTFRRYIATPFNNYTLLSISIKELWSKRYNLIVRDRLHRNIFKPLIHYGYSPAFAAFAAFFMSGILHVFIVWKHLNNLQGMFTTFLFFVLHGIICIMESYIYPRNKLQKRDDLNWFVIIIRIMITNIIFALTLPLYIGLYVKEYPEIGVVINQTYGEPFKYLDVFTNYLPVLPCVYPSFVIE